MRQPGTPIDGWAIARSHSSAIGRVSRSDHYPKKGLLGRLVYSLWGRSAEDAPRIYYRYLYARDNAKGIYGINHLQNETTNTIVPSGTESTPYKSPAFLPLEKRV